jgi:hypothetical protein
MWKKGCLCHYEIVILWFTRELFCLAVSVNGRIVFSDVEATEISQLTLLMFNLATKPVHCLKRSTQ